MSKELKLHTDLHITRHADKEGRWIIEGIATTADLDVDGLYISEEALIGAEGDLRKYTTLLYNHDRDKEIGKILEVKYMPEQRALWIKALISKTVPDIWQKVQEEVLNKFSVSGTALDFTEKFVKGLDKVVQYVNQMRLFETSLVTVPADASARTMAFYVEKSMKQFNKESTMASKAKAKDKEIKKSQEDAPKKEETVSRDAKALELLVTSVEDALGTEEREVQVTTLRSVLDFLKALEATTGSEDLEKTAGISIEDIAKAVDEKFESRFNDIKETIVELAKVSKSVVENDKEDKKDDEIVKSADDDEKTEDKEIVKSADEKTDTKDDEILELKRSISKLTDTINNNLPIRKGVGSESHKEDERGEKKETDITKTTEYKAMNPIDKLKALYESQTPEVNEK